MKSQVNRPLEFNQIKPDHPFRFAGEEKEVLAAINQKLTPLIAKQNCSKAILVGHNAHFDLNFFIQDKKHLTYSRLMH